MEKYNLEIKNVRIEKSYRGRLSGYNGGPKKYFFVGHFKFNTGSLISIMLTQAREAYSELQTIDVTYKEEREAIEQAWQEYQSTEKALSNPNFAYGRARSYGVTLYARDSESPSGVSSIGGCSTMALVNYIKNGSAVLSPTEGLKSTGFRY